MLERIIRPRAKDLGDFEVRRVLPDRERPRVGPFVFFDHFGPVDFPPGKGIEVRPHPHVNLATVTYLFDGAIVHRDSLGIHQEIRPGDVNWMTAGRGIVHSERSVPALKQSGWSLHGLQSWVALPVEHEEVPPAFHHHPAASIPEFEFGGVRARVVAGTAYRHESPVAVFSPTLYVDANLPAGATLSVPAEHEERAVYVANGAVRIDGEAVEAGAMAVLAADVEVRIDAAQDSRAMLLGGAALAGERHLWWNFVSSRPERIEQAKADWREGRFDRVPDDDEFIPLPDDAA